MSSQILVCKRCGVELIAGGLYASCPCCGDMITSAPPQVTGRPRQPKKRRTKP